MINFNTLTSWVNSSHVKTMTAESPWSRNAKRSFIESVFDPDLNSAWKIPDLLYGRPIGSDQVWLAIPVPSADCKAALDLSGKIQQIRRAASMIRNYFLSRQSKIQVLRTAEYQTSQQMRQYVIMLRGWWSLTNSKNRRDWINTQRGRG